MKNLATLSLLLIFLSVMVYSGCKDTITGDEIDARIIPETNVSYSTDIQPVLNVKCANSGCHDDATRAAGLSLTTYNYTILDPNVVFPGKPDNSSLVWVIEGKSGVYHPFLYYPLTPSQIKGVKTWITEGAKNN